MQTPDFYYHILLRSQVLEILKPFEAVWIGSIPIDVHIENSDIDVACFYTKELEQTLITHFKTYEHFELKVSPQVLVCRFSFENTPFEIYAEAISPLLQRGYLHMIAEKNLLETHGEKLREDVRNLKRKGLKTEPAFAEALGISGDSYIELLKYV